MGPLVIFDQSPFSFLPRPSLGGGPTVLAGGRRLLGAIRGWERIRRSRAILPVVERVSGAKGFAGGELWGKRRLREQTGQWPTVTPSQGCEEGWLRGVEGEWVVAWERLGDSGVVGFNRDGGERHCRRRGGRPLPAVWWLGEALRERRGAAPGWGSKEEAFL